jgi:hypothetical protein
VQRSVFVIVPVVNFGVVRVGRAIHLLVMMMVMVVAMVVHFLFIIIVVIAFR